ncbi:helix-turn-helix domain-containing protein [Cohnella thailandensis]|uniref:Helix-turn-helix transcriptional regulator n=1 Tax=Cohnella thailandensis TaxID=557557 RepID=A0A841SNY1_9BACL|nr:helix-turn-helix transcriptional regulator [Cohnella thailandensis]
MGTISVKHNLSQISFADEIGISQGRLSEIEQGKTKKLLNIKKSYKSAGKRNFMFDTKC